MPATLSSFLATPFGSEAGIFFTLGNLSFGKEIMETEKALKPWDELSDLEKREALARRLGWTRWSDGRWFKGQNNHTNPARGSLPDWPTNDGLAFTEVWPKIAQSIQYGQMKLWAAAWEGYPELCPTVSNDERFYLGDTWAAAICRAAYELLPSK